MKPMLITNPSGDLPAIRHAAFAARPVRNAVADDSALIPEPTPTATPTATEEDPIGGARRSGTFQTRFSGPYAFRQPWSRGGLNE